MLKLFKSILAERAERQRLAAIRAEYVADMSELAELKRQRYERGRSAVVAHRRFNALAAKLAKKHGIAESYILMDVANY